MPTPEPAPRLPELLRRAWERGLATGALEPLPVERVEARAGSWPFWLHLLDPRDRKERLVAGERAAGLDPFLPPDPRLLVAPLRAGGEAPRHLAVLNKFPALPLHLLVVTADFAPQEELLEPADLAALWACMAEVEGLGFYNAGPAAGASQPHRHLQLVPEPPEPAPWRAWTRRFAELSPLPEPGRHPELPFPHALLELPARGLHPDTEPARAGALLHRAYLELLGAVGLEPAAPHGPQPGPYNLLLTRRWMWLVPRSGRPCPGVGLNALAFAGSLLVKDRRRLPELQADPFLPLRRVAGLSSTSG